MKLNQFMRIIRRCFQLLLLIPLFFILVLVLYIFLEPPFTPQTFKAYITQEEIQQDWIPIEKAPNKLKFTLISLADRNFCRHWGFDYILNRDAIRLGQPTSESITYKTVENLFFWRSDSFLKTILTTSVSLLAELLWSKERIFEFYINSIQFDQNSFGIVSAASNFFGKELNELHHEEIALLTIILTDPSQNDTENLTQEQFETVISIIAGLSDFELGDPILCVI